MNVEFRLTNGAGEFLSNLAPVTFSANEDDALVISEDKDKIDHIWLTKNILTKIETIFTYSKFKEPLILYIHREKESAPDYKITISSTIVTSALNTDATISDDLLDFYHYCTKIISSNILDILLRSKATSGLTDTIEELRTSLGMSSPSSRKLEDIDNVDELVDRISKTTKAEIVHPKETLDDYVCDETLKKELNEIVDFYENAKIYKENNISIPKGILFKGPWGTGKTYAARCIAGTVKCWFMTCTASSLQGMYIGSGAENIRNVFKGAKALAEASKKAVIVFIDELDSFGDRQNRGAGASGEEDRTLNQLLAEMSGFEDSTDILVLAATNFPERLDAALLRSGRFGRQITIGYPEDEERLHLVKYYFDKINIKISTDTCYEEIAELMKGLTPADIKEIANESAILAIRNKHTDIELEDINEAVNKVITKNIRRPDKSKEELALITAHECGHALAEMLYYDTVPIKVTNYAYGDIGGFTQSASNLQNGLKTAENFEKEIKILLAGRVAEKVICDTITNGASNDLAKAKAIIKNYFETYNFEKYDVKELNQLIIDRIDVYYGDVLDLFEKNKVLLQKLTDELADKRILYASDLILFKKANRELMEGIVC
jgi:cell division protease FtsH